MIISSYTTFDNTSLVFLAILILVYYMTWQSQLGPFLGWFTVAYSVLVCALWFFGQDLRIRSMKRDFNHFRGTFFRSLTPILAAFILILGLTASFYLTVVERQQVKQLNLPGTRLFIDEIEYTAFKHYRARLAEEYRSLNDQ